MKTSILMVLFGLMTQSALASEARIELSVAPLAPEVKAQVLGIKVQADGRAAIVFTGKAAAAIAQEAGQVIDTSTQMIVATGTDAAELVTGAAARAATGALDTAEMVVVSTSKFAGEALDLALRSARTGAATLEKATRSVAKTAYQGAAFAYGALKSLTAASVLAITEAGELAFQASRRTGEIARKALATAGIEVSVRFN
jgi:hypothetical protein